MNNFLIYYSLGFENCYTYIHLLKASIETLNKTGYNGDILIIIDDQRVETLIKDNIHISNQLFFCNVSNCLSDLFPQNSPTYKLLIQQFKSISFYEKILFCDVDTIWLKHPLSIFNVINDEGISFGNGLRFPTEVLMSHEIGVWGRWLLSDHELCTIQQQVILGSNTGIFGFTAENIHVLTKTYEFMKSVVKLIRNNYNNKNDIEFVNKEFNIDMKFCIKAQEKIQELVGAEQPFLNVCAWRLNKYNRNLTNLAFNGGSRHTFIKDYLNNHFKDLCIVHFSDNIGSFETKIKNINNFLSNIRSNNLIKN